MKNSFSIKARRDFPDGYARFWGFDIRQKREALFLTILGVVLLFAAWLVFFPLARSLHPNVFSFNFQANSIEMIKALIFLGELLLVTVLMLVLHEGLHGLFFWLFTGERPKFDFKIYYASAAAPDWYFPRWQYFFIALAPLVGITLLCLAVLAWLPAALAIPAFIMLLFNTSGAVGDLWVAARLVFCPRTTYVRDYGDGIDFFA
jgi:hypothetical protein